MFFIQQIRKQFTLTLVNPIVVWEAPRGWAQEMIEPTLHTNEEWFQLLTPEQKDEINELVNMRKALKEELRFDNLDKITNFPEGFENLSYEEKVDLLQREIDMYKIKKERERLQRELREDYMTKEGRHGFAENMFQTTTPESREWLIGKDLESLTAGDIYSMKESWVDLAELFLIQWIGDIVSKGNMKVWDSYKVNFWKCKSADRLIWIGDIIDIENVSRISVNGVVGIRWYDPRPGYYTMDHKYLAVHDGYQVEILEMNSIAEQEQETLFAAQENRFKTIRSEDIRNVVYGLTDYTEDLPFTQDHDVELVVWVFESAGIEGVSYNNESKKLEFPDWINFADTKEILNWYRGVRRAIIDYVLENDAVWNSEWESLVLEIPEYSSSLVEKALVSMIGTNSIQWMSFDIDTMTLSTNNRKTIRDTLWGGFEYLWSGTKHLTYLPELQRASTEEGIPLGVLITLIYKENGQWNTRASPAWSSAYGLGQMIDGTWEIYWRWLNRYDAWDQLLATTRYMRAIKDRQQCPWEHVLAYYNTGEWIRNVSQSKIEEYGKLNYGAITVKIPSGVPLSHESYFTAAVAYYNSISYQDAELTMRVV